MEFYLIGQATATLLILGFQAWLCIAKREELTLGVLLIEIIISTIWPALIVIFVCFLLSEFMKWIERKFKYLCSVVIVKGKRDE